MGSRMYIRFIFPWFFRPRGVWLRLKYTDRPIDDFGPWAPPMHSPSGRGGVYFPDRPVAPRGADGRLAGLETSHYWHARWFCSRHLVVDAMDGRVAHSDDGVADHDSRRYGSIPIARTAVQMGRSALTRNHVSICGDVWYRGDGERRRSALFSGCLPEVGLSDSREFSWNQPRPIGIFHDWAHAVFHTRRTRH